MIRVDKIDFTSIGRGDLITYCENLRTLLAAADPANWVHNVDVQAASKWEHDARVAVNRKAGK